MDLLLFMMHAVCWDCAEGMAWICIVGQSFLITVLIGLCWSGSAACEDALGFEA